MKRLRVSGSARIASYPGLAMPCPKKGWAKKTQDTGRASASFSPLAQV